MAVVFLSVCGSFAALMYLSITTFSAARSRSNAAFFRFQQNQNQNQGWAFQEVTPKAAEPAPVTAGWTKIVLIRDREDKVGGAVLTYRGLGPQSTVRIDAVIPDLDTQYTYLQRFDIDRARNGFKVGGARLKLISANRYRIRLLHYIPAR